MIDINNINKNFIKKYIESKILLFKHVNIAYHFSEKIFSNSR
jgi:hypothetical protein